MPRSLLPAEREAIIALLPGRKIALPEHRHLAQRLAEASGLSLNRVLLAFGPWDISWLDFIINYKPVIRGRLSTRKLGQHNIKRSIVVQSARMQ